MAKTLRETIEAIALTACEPGDAIWASEAQQIAEAMLTDPRIEVRPRGADAGLDRNVAAELYANTDRRDDD